MMETPPDGEHFASSVKHILRMEEQWIAWKNDGCKAFTEPKAATAGAKPSNGANGDANGGGAAKEEVTGAGPKVVLSTRKRRRKIGDQIQDAMAAKKFLMGNQQLTRLWNLAPDNMEACSAEERDFLPKMEEYFEDAIEELVPANQVEDQYK